MPPVHSTSRDRLSVAASFQTKTTIARLLDEAGIAPRRRFGQHFLIDQNLMRRLVDAADLTGNDQVLEVGTGTGSLTALLARRAARVLTVEVDAGVGRIAARQLADLHNITLIRKSAIAPAVLEPLHRAEQAGCSLKLVANLPYDVATPLVVNLVIALPRLRRYCFTVQTEVANRFFAKPATPDYGPISIITQTFTSGAVIGRVPPSAFWPRPRVDSSMLRLDALADPIVPTERRQTFADFVRGFFLHRRKTMGHLVRHRSDAPAVTAAMDDLAITARQRPEQIAVGDWWRLFEALA